MSDKTFTHHKFYWNLKNKSLFEATAPAEVWANPKMAKTEFGRNMHEVEQICFSHNKSSNDETVDFISTMNQGRLHV